MLRFFTSVASVIEWTIMAWAALMVTGAFDPAGAAAPEGIPGAAHNPDSVVRSLMQELHYNGPAPSITRVNQHELVEICQCKSSRGGIYRDSSIYLWIGIDLDTLFGQSIVLHELQHHLQFIKHGEFRGCHEWARRELEAIRVQNEWLSEHGSASRALYMGGCKE